MKFYKKNNYALYLAGLLNEAYYPVFGNKKKWKDVFSDFIIEFEKQNNILTDAHTGNPLPSELNQIIDAHYGEITINFSSSGNYDPGTGPHGYDPPDRDEERLFHSATYKSHSSILNRKELPIPNNIGEKLFDLYRNKIEDVEIDI